MEIDVNILKKDETFIIIQCERGIARELSDYFCFFTPNYMFMPAYRNKMWDGKIRLFSTRDNSLYLGLYQHVVQFCVDRKYSYKLDDDLLGNKHRHHISRDILKKFLDVDISLTKNSGTKPITPFDYQIGAFKMAIEKEKQLILSPTGSGKSLILYLVIRYLIDKKIIPHDMKILLVVPSTSLVEQMYTDFADYSYTDSGFVVEKECHRIYGGRDKDDITKRIYISTWQSIHRSDPEYFEKFYCVLGDECHEFKAKSLTSILKNCVYARYKIGTTATLDNTETHQLILRGLFGDVHKASTTKKLIDRNILSNVSIDIMGIQYKLDDVVNDKLYPAPKKGKISSKLTYQEEIAWLVTHNKRNRFIANLTKITNGNTLILFAFVDMQGIPLYEMIKEKYKDNKRKISFISGKIKTEDREIIRKQTEKEKDAVIVASYGTFKRGINIVNLHNIIFASPYKSQITILQSIGRGIRKSDNGQELKIYDIVDSFIPELNSDISIAKNYAHQHGKERIKLYLKEGFPFKYFPIK